MAPSPTSASENVDNRLRRHGGDAGFRRKTASGNATAAAAAAPAGGSCDTSSSAVGVERERSCVGAKTTTTATAVEEDFDDPEEQEVHRLEASGQLVEVAGSQSVLSQELVLLVGNGNGGDDDDGDGDGGPQGQHHLLSLLGVDDEEEEEEEESKTSCGRRSQRDERESRNERKRRKFEAKDRDDDRQPEATVLKHSLLLGGEAFVRPSGSARDVEEEDEDRSCTQVESESQERSDEDDPPDLSQTTYKLAESANFGTLLDAIELAEQSDPHQRRQEASAGTADSAGLATIPELTSSGEAATTNAAAPAKEETPSAAAAAATAPPPPAALHPYAHYHHHHLHHPAMAYPPFPAYHYPYLHYPYPIPPPPPPHHHHPAAGTPYYPPPVHPHHYLPAAVPPPPPAPASAEASAAAPLKSAPPASKIAEVKAEVVVRAPVSAPIASEVASTTETAVSDAESPKEKKTRRKPSSRRKSKQNSSNKKMRKGTKVKDTLAAKKQKDEDKRRFSMIKSRDAAANADAQMAKRAADLAAVVIANPGLAKRLLLSMACYRHTVIQGVERKYPSGHEFKDGFHWAHYPPLEDILKDNMSDYFKYSTECPQSSVQHNYNNKLMKLVKAGTYICAVLAPKLGQSSPFRSCFCSLIFSSAQSRSAFVDRRS